MNPVDLPDETLFEQALQCRSAAERVAYLDRVCAGQPELRKKLEELLAAHDRSGQFLEPAVEAPRPTVRIEFADGEETSGTLIGRYKLLQKIGEGGMGVVYMAEQTEPVVRKVALKIIKLGMDTKQVVARFEAERQALALMDHPNIAKVLDAGATETGRPYFVMELVHGVPITEYCDKNKLSTQLRLELFIPVCQAIQHAHQKGIIHRDLKPSNVMVTLHDGVPVPKVIDFGVAKATNQRLTEKTLFTHYAQMIGTPAYMSPEQAEMSGLDIDTRSDIYSLGVLLYELLTGSTPFEAKELLSKGYAEMQRIIVEQEPMRPSTRMSTLTQEQRMVVATQRSTEAGALRRVLQGDLDWIVMKCLEKDRARRYDASNDLAADLRRHLANELITARPPTTAYLLKKLIKRNRLAFAASAAIAMSLVLGLVVSALALHRESRSRLRAEKNFSMARRVVDESLRTAIKELEAFPKTAQIRRKLEEQVLEYYRDFADQNRNDPALQRAVAGAFWQVAMYYQGFGQFDKSLEFAERSAAVYEALATKYPTDRAYREGLMHSIKLQGFAASTLGNYSNYVGRLSQAAALAKKFCDDFPDEPRYPLEAATVETDLGIALGTRAYFTESIDHYRLGLKYLETYTTRFPRAPRHAGTEAKIHLWLGASLQGLNRLDDAEQHIRQALTMRQQLAVERPETDDEDLPGIKSYLASAIKWDRPQEAIQLLREVVASYEKFHALNPDTFSFPRLLQNARRQLADLLLDIGQLDQAEALYQRGLKFDLESKEPVRTSLEGGSSLAANYYGLGKVLDKRSQAPEAAEHFGRALAALDDLLNRNTNSLTSQSQFAGMLLRCPQKNFQDPVRAAQLLATCLRLAPRSQNVWMLLGVAQLKNGQTAEAISSLRRSVEITGIGGADQWLYLAMALHQAGEKAEARQWYEKAVAWIDKTRAQDSGYLLLRKEAALLVER